MVTDPIFYELFALSPETFFLLLGMADDQAKLAASRYRYGAIEFKETAHRADGVFEPTEPKLPVFFLEVQFYPSPSIDANVLAKAYIYLKQHDPKQPFCAVVLFAGRNLEPADLAPYQALVDTGMLRRVFLDELAASADGPLGLAIASLIGLPEHQAPDTARTLVARAKSEIEDEALSGDLVELIETVIMYKLPRLGRQEIQAMLQIHDIRESRVYQEALEEGIEKGRQEGFLIAKLAERQMSAADIADLLGLDLEVVVKAIHQTLPPNVGN